MRSSVGAGAVARVQGAGAVASVQGAGAGAVAPGWITGPRLGSNIVITEL